MDECGTPCPLDFSIDQHDGAAPLLLGDFSFGLLTCQSIRKGEHWEWMVQSVLRGNEAGGFVIVLGNTDLCFSRTATPYNSQPHPSSGSSIISIIIHNEERECVIPSVLSKQEGRGRSRSTINQSIDR
jgi:hypothetical protein